DRGVERRPAHQLGIEEVPWLAANLPDPLVLLLPLRRRAVGGADEEALHGVVELSEIPLERAGRTHELAVHVDLPLVPCTVADAHRPAVTPSSELRQFALGDIA